MSDNLIYIDKYVISIAHTRSKALSKMLNIINQEGARVVNFKREPGITYAYCVRDNQQITYLTTEVN